MIFVKMMRPILKEKTGYLLKSSTILNQVFTRSSYTAETGMANNEVFEFIGDQVLNYYVMKVLANRCGSVGLTDQYTFRINENQFTSIKQRLVNNESLAKIIDEWDVVKYLQLGRSDIKNEVIKETKVKADLLEAIIGGIAIDCNWDQEILENVIIKVLDLESKITSLIKNDRKVKQVNIDNAITVLKELAEQGDCTMPKYTFYEFEYFKDEHMRWACRCDIINDKVGLNELVYASSKKDAKKAAAYLILCEHLNMQNEYGPNQNLRLYPWIYKDKKLIPIKKPKIYSNY